MATEQAQTSASSFQEAKGEHAPVQAAVTEIPDDTAKEGAEHNSGEATSTGFQPVTDEKDTGNEGAEHKSEEATSTGFQPVTDEKDTANEGAEHKSEEATSTGFQPVTDEKDNGNPEPRSVNASDVKEADDPPQAETQAQNEPADTNHTVNENKTEATSDHTDAAPSEPQTGPTSDHQKPIEQSGDAQKHDGSGLTEQSAPQEAASAQETHANHGFQSAGQQQQRINSADLEELKQAVQEAMTRLAKAEELLKKFEFQPAISV